jgi:hypothetical protein
MWSNERLDPTTKPRTLDSTVAIFTPDEETQIRISKCLSEHGISHLPPEAEPHRMRLYARLESATVFIVDFRTSPDGLIRMINSEVSAPDTFCILLGERTETEERLEFAHTFLHPEANGEQLIHQVNIGFKFRKSVYLKGGENSPQVTVCAWCRKIQKGEEWLGIAEFFGHEPETPINHGICDSCAEDMLKDVRKAWRVRGVEASVKLENFTNE